MNIIQRIEKILIAIVMIAGAFFLMLLPSEPALIIIIMILASGLVIKSVGDIIFYFRMARHMVGGKLILFKGVMMLDFAFLTLSLVNIPTVFMLLYLIAAHAFSGAVDVLRAMESRRTVEGPWKLKFAHGVVNLALAAVCLIFINSMDVAVLIYSGGLMYSALINFISAFRRTSFVLIE